MRLEIFAQSYDRILHHSNSHDRSTEGPGPWVLESHNEQIKINSKTTFLSLTDDLILVNFLILIRSIEKVDICAVPKMNHLNNRSECLLCANKSNDVCQFNGQNCQVKGFLIHLT